MKTHVAVICSAAQQKLCACMDKITEPYSGHVASYVHENNGLVCQHISYEFIHEANVRRAHVSKFIHIYIDFRYAGVTTELKTPARHNAAFAKGIHAA